MATETAPAIEKMFNVIDPSGEEHDIEADTLAEAQTYCDDKFYDRMRDDDESTRGEHEEDGWVIVELQLTDDDPVELARHDYTATFEDYGSDYEQHNTLWRGCAI